MDFNYVFKLATVGDSGVGKTSIMYNFVHGAAPADTNITVGVEFGSRCLEVGPWPYAQNVKMQVWDTSGQEKFRSITRSYYRGVAGCLVVYDVTSRASFDHVQGWLNEVRKLSSSEQTVVMLVGTKTDLAEQRVVTTEEGQSLAGREDVLFAETHFREPSDMLFRAIGGLIYERRDMIHAGIRKINTVRPPATPPPLSSMANEGCCFLFF